MRISDLLGDGPDDDDGRDSTDPPPNRTYDAPPSRDEAARRQFGQLSGELAREARDPTHDALSEPAPPPPEPEPSGAIAAPAEPSGALAPPPPTSDGQPSGQPDGAPARGAPGYDEWQRQHDPEALAAAPPPVPPRRVFPVEMPAPEAPPTLAVPPDDLLPVRKR